MTVISPVQTVPRPEGAVDIEKTDVEFSSNGVLLRGHLLRPVERPAPLAAIVMAPGLSGVKEGATGKYAEYFARGGFAVLAFDNACFGASEGLPRQEADPHVQRQGYRDAITYMCLRPEVDAHRIGVWGTSYSGGHVLEIGAHDRRVKCVVSQTGFLNGFYLVNRRPSPEQRAATQAQFRADREARFQGGAPAMIKMVSDDPAVPSVNPGQASYDYFMAQAKTAPSWKNELTLRSVDMLAGLENSVFTPYVSPTPLLMILALGDEYVSSELSLAAYERALEPKRLVMVPGNHVSPYEEEFHVTGPSALDWFRLHLWTGGSAALNPRPIASVSAG